MNRKIIGKTLGFLLLLECVFLFPSAFIAILDHQRELLGAFVASMAVAPPGWGSPFPSSAGRPKAATTPGRAF